MAGQQLHAALLHGLPARPGGYTEKGFEWGFGPEADPAVAAGELTYSCTMWRDQVGRARGPDAVFLTRRERAGLKGARPPADLRLHRARGPAARLPRRQLARVAPRARARPQRMGAHSHALGGAPARGARACMPAHVPAGRSACPGAKQPCGR